MSTEINWAIVVQARSGSSRLPNKMLQPFEGGHSLISFILGKLSGCFGRDRVILATTDSVSDNAIAVEGNKLQIRVFRGSEADVLDRFIQASGTYRLTHVVRVCADNPFLSPDFMQQLVETGAAHPEMDYVSWFFSDGRPTILSHSGFFAEWVSCAALNRVAELTDDPFYHEHVTNYIYSHAHRFQILKIPVPPAHESFFASVRLTIDTSNDLAIARAVFSELSAGGSTIRPEDIRAYLEAHPELKDEMRLNIQQNEK